MQTGIRQKGFTLIEVMMVVAIVAILVGIALPAYQNSMMRSNRAPAKGGLMDVMSRQEQYFMNNKSYSTSLANLGLPAAYYIDDTGQQVTSSDSKRIYQITLSATAATSYTTTAIPQLSQANDTDCANLSLSSTGVRAESGTLTTDECW
jgi:type IV pilus assembly protein PilE